MKAIKRCARCAAVLAMVLLFSGCSLYQMSREGLDILASKYIGGEQAEQPDAPDTEAPDEASDSETPDETTAADEPEESEADGIPGTYTVPDGWVKAEDHSTSEFIFYTREGETQDAQPDNISINVGSNLYSLEESGMFLEAVMRQLAMQAEAANAKDLTGSGSITEQGYTLFTFTIEGADGTKAKQHYIVKNYGYCLIYATSFSGSEEVFDVAQSMVDSFVWDEDSTTAAE